MSKKVVKEDITETDSNIEATQEQKTKVNAKEEKPKKQKKPTEKGKLKRKASETVAELKKVNWPTFKSVLVKTGIVLAFCASSLVMLLLVDLLFKFLVGLIGL